MKTLLYALQDEDFDTADSVLADNVVWQKIGVVTLRGRERIVKHFRRGQGRAGFEVKIHRIAAGVHVVEAHA